MPKAKIPCKCFPILIPNNIMITKVQHLSFEYFTSRGVTLAGAKAANRV